MLESVFRLLKVTVIIGVAAVFMLAINALLSFISFVVFGNIVAEVFALISMYLPFNASAVFGAIYSATFAILSFLVAKKIFDLTSWSLSSA